jgi:hypothetical protein
VHRRCGKQCGQPRAIAPNTAPIQARSFIATKLITDFLIKINDLGLVYSIVTVAPPLSVTASGFVEFRKGPRTGLADG